MAQSFPLQSLLALKPLWCGGLCVIMLACAGEKGGEGGTDSIPIDTADTVDTTHSILEGPEWPCQAQEGEDFSWLDTLGCASDFAAIEAEVTGGISGQMRSVKVIFDLSDSSLYYVNSNLYQVHFDFAVAALGWPSAQHGLWDQTQYRANPERRFLLASINHMTGAGLWVLELFPGDDAPAHHLRLLHKEVAATSWFGSAVRYMAFNEASLQRAQTAGIPHITPDELYGEQKFQSLNVGEAYGTLVRAQVDTVAEGDFGRRDIVFTNGIPNDLPVVGGIITTTFQTPLSHINVLSSNRGTPNMAWKPAWNDSLFRALEGRLVHLRVTLDDFVLEHADTSAARAYWDSTGPGVPPVIGLDTSVTALVNVLQLSRSDLSAVGAKAANFGELALLARSYQGYFRVPEGAFAIPIVHYFRHLQTNGLVPLVDSLLADPLFATSSGARRTGLQLLQSRILAAPLDSVLLDAVVSRMESSGYSSLRFRSSTNAEDLAEFNGAGLYASFTGSLTDPSKPVARAIKQVWAGLWNYRAYEEREWFGIDSRSTGMGVLVHRNFPDEAVNGVALTRNIYQPDYWGLVINSQLGDVQVVDPPPGVTSEQLVYFPFDTTVVGELAVQYITLSSEGGGAPLISDAEIQKLGRALILVQQHFYPMLADPEVGLWQFGMDIEFKFDGTSRALYLKQARPLGS